MTFSPETSPSPLLEKGDTYAEFAASVLRRAILTGELGPGEKLKIKDLQERYGIGATPLREGMSRLVANGLIEFQGQKGFRVVPTSEADLRDIIRVRKLIEIEALQLAIANGDDEWEAGILAALHRMSKACASSGPFSEGIVAFDAVHKRFHYALIAACGSPRLIEMQGQLYDQTYRYRQVMFESNSRRGIAIEEHQRLAEVTIARQVEPACELLAQHLSHTLIAAYGDIQGER